MTELGLAAIRIVLVEPAGALNVGAIARVMKNMGLQHLVLVKPKCDPVGEEARLMAVHAADVLEAAIVVSTLPEALQGCQRAIATTARPRVSTVLEPPRTALPWLLEAVSQERSAIIFGPEDRGLSNEELNYAQRFVAIPSSPAYASLNLAQAVAICCYELYQWEQEVEGRGGKGSKGGRGREVEGRGEGAEGRGQGVEGVDELEVVGRAREQEHLDSTLETQNSKLKTQNSTHPLPTPHSPPAPLDVLEGYYHQLEALLLAIGYLHPHTAASRMQKFRRLYNRALLSSEEVAMLRGILSQVEWAIQKINERKSSPSGGSVLADAENDRGENILGS
ncbi:MAG: RNA methyltransferase [Stenomitos rutilans HA7619-LM2]|nr:RNA methyltransferase [Stenomitos rutilans HA7619-LM2]